MKWCPCGNEARIPHVKGSQVLCCHGCPRATRLPFQGDLVVGMPLNPAECEADKSQEGLSQGQEEQEAIQQSYLLAIMRTPVGKKISSFLL